MVSVPGQVATLLDEWALIRSAGRVTARGELSPEALERELVEFCWLRLRELPLADLRDELRRGYPLSTPAWFHHLQKVSRAEGRNDRGKGVELARLALESLEAVRTALAPNDHARLLAKAWLRLGNAQRLALDYAAAEDSFASAEVLLADASAPTELRAELAWLRCELRRFQRRFREALEHAEEAVAISQGNAALHARALLRRGAAWWHLQRFDRAAEDYRAASEEPTLAADPFLCCAALQSLASALILEERYDEARDALEQANRLSVQHGDRSSLCHAQWAEGVLSARNGGEATGEENLRAAREGFRTLGDSGHFAVISLDLAEVLAANGKTEDCLAILAEALPPLQTMKLENEGLVALKLLAIALQERHVRLDLVEKVRASARLLPDARPTTPGHCPRDRPADNGLGS